MSVTLGLSWRDDLMISRFERPVKTREKPSTKGPVNYIKYTGVYIDD